MLKTFLPLIGLLHTYTHALPCIPVQGPKSCNFDIDKNRSKLTKLTLLTLFTTNLLITDQMALKYTHVCLFKPVFINVKVT